MGVVQSSRLWSTSQLLRPSGQQCSHSGGVCPQIQGSECGAYVGAVEEMMCVVCVSVTEGHSGNGYDLASTLCKFVLSWARARRVRRGNIFSDLLMCGGGVRSILLFPPMARCLETIDVCVWRMFVFMSVVVWGVCGNVCCVAAVVKDSVLALEC